MLNWGELMQQTRIINSKILYVYYIGTIVPIRK